MKKNSIIFLFFLWSCYAHAQSYTATGQLNVARWFHQSQLLSNGKVLVFGGDDGYLFPVGVYTSSELYNPTTGTWTYSGNMQEKRTSFCSAVLPNGNVLAIGGLQNWNGSDAYTTASCEIYDVATATWTYTDSMKLTRENHRAILLKNGKVLVVGGGTNICELYDPSVNKWFYTGRNNSSFGYGLDIVMLQDGKVLVTEGSIAELYDPSSGTWQTTGNLNGDREYHSSVLLPDGRVLLAGSTRTTDQNTAELYDPITKTFTPTGRMVEYRAGSPMILMDNGNVLAYGIGDFFSPSDTKVIEVYNPATGIWTSNVYTQIGAQDYRIQKLADGTILVSGGSFTTLNGASRACVIINQNIIGCTMPNLSMSFSGSSTCVGNTAQVSLSNSQSGVNYFVSLGNTEIVGFTGNGSTQSFTIPSSAISNGNNVYSIRVAKPGCPSFMLNDTAVIVAQFSVPKPVLSPAGTSTVCNGDSVLISAPVGYAQYLWSNNKTTPTQYVKTAGSYSAMVTAANGCISIYSDSATLLVNPVLTTALSITADANPVDSGTVVTFTAVPVHPGSAPGYQWKLNGANTGTNSLLYTSNQLITGDKVSCIMTSNAVCPSAVTVPSNTVSMTVNPVIQRPYVSMVNPFAYKGNNAAGTNVDITFSKLMNPAVSNKNNIQLYGSYTGSISGAYSGAGTNKTTFNPALNFKPGEKITVVIDSSAMSANNIKINTGYVYDFNIAPTPSSGIFVQGTNISQFLQIIMVKTADFNRDGFIDIVGIESGRDRLVILLGKGDATFYLPLYFDGFPDAEDIALADFNNDGAMDMVVSHFDYNGVSVCLNNGHGIFTNQIVTTNVGTMHVITGDFDGDGDVDLASASEYSINDKTIYVRWNDGAGNFSGTISIVLPNIPGNLYSGDIDGDGDLDIISSCNNSLLILKNNGRGTFVLQYTAFPANQYPIPYGVADYNGDGKLDILISLYSSLITQHENIGILSNLGNGVFSSFQQSIPIFSGIPSITSADFDGDGDLDIGLVQADYTISADSMSIWLNNSSGSFTFSNKIRLGVNISTRAIASADFDGDGDLDIATANWGLNNISIMLNGGTVPSITIPAFADKKICAGSTLSIPFVASGIFNSTNVFTLQLSDATGSFSSPTTLGTSASQVSGVIEGLIPVSMVTGNLYKIRITGSAPSTMSSDNGIEMTVQTGCPLITALSPQAGKENVALTDSVKIVFSAPVNVATASTAAISLNGSYTGAYTVNPRGSFINNAGTVTFDPTVNFMAGEKLSVTVDTNAQTQSGQSLIRPYSYSFTTKAAVAPALFTIASSLPNAGAEIMRCGGDFNNDRTVDFVTSNGSILKIYSNDGTGTFSSTSMTIGGSVNSAISFDFDKDGDLDLAVSYATGKIGIFQNNGSASFTSSFVYTLSADVTQINAADINGDTYPDLLGIEYANNKCNVFLNQSGAGFATQSYVETGINPVEFALEDFDGDGDVDLATVNWNDNTITIVSNDGAGNFYGRKNLPSAQWGRKLRTFDFNGDKAYDLIYHTTYPSSLVILFNDGKGNFPSSKTIPLSTGGDYELTVADFEGDQDLDIVLTDYASIFSLSKNDGAGNFSAFTLINSGGYWGASSGGIFSADFDGDGDMDITNVRSSDVVCFINELSITTKPISFSVFCQGDKIKVPFAYRGIPIGSTFRVEMSQAGGSFAGAQTIGTGKVSAIECTIPILPVGAGYRIRVVNDSMNVMGADNGMNLTVTTGCPVLDTLLPHSNQAFVPAGTDIIAVYKVPLDPSAGTATNMKISGRHSGVISGTGVFSGVGTDSIIFNPTKNFFPGESVSVTLRKEIEAAGNISGVRSFVYDFSVKTAPAPGAFIIKEKTIFAPTGNGFVDVAAADLDKDGDLDMVFINEDNNTASVKFNINGFFANATDYSVGNYPQHLWLEDVDGDTDIDILTTNYSGQHISLLKNDGLGGFGAFTTILTGAVPGKLCMADFDGDGDRDIATANSAYSISIIKNDGAGNFSNSALLSTLPNSPVGICAVDIDFDGDIDLVTTNGNGVLLLLNDGDASFTTKNINIGANNAQFIFAADFNKDGKMDLAIMSATLSVLTNQGNYQFAMQTLPAYSPLGALTMSDIDGDDDVDFILSGADSLITIKNDGTGGFSIAEKTYVEVSSRALAAFDLDGDKDIDVASIDASATSFFTTLINEKSILIANTVPFSFCIGSPIAVQYDPNFIFQPGNTFTLQLSDINGSFATPVNLPGALLRTNSGTIQSSIPDTITSGFYKIRVVGSKPLIYGVEVQETIYPKPVISAGADQQVCAGVNVILSGSGLYSYVWDNNVVDGVPFTPTATKTYSVMATNTYGCSDTDQVVVTVIPAPALNAGVDQIVCYGTQVTLKATGADTYNWLYGGANGSTITVYYSSDYLVTGTDTVTNCSATDMVHIEMSTCTEVKDGVQSKSVVKIYPNPTSDILYIDAAVQPDMLLLYDAHGQEVLRAEHADKINIKGIANGIYLLKIITDKTTLMSKITIQQ